MPSYNFKITIQLIKPIREPPPSFEEWYPLLANIYGTPSKSFDGYVSTVEYSDTTILIQCYLVEDTSNTEKLLVFKQRYSDWNGYQQICIMDAVKLHSRVLGYTISSIAIVSS
jgi:hypothetical protein